MHLQLSVRKLCALLEVPLPEGSFSADHLIHQVIIDSRSPLISAHTLFFALPGHKTDGHYFLEDFRQKGGRFAVVSEGDKGAAVHQIRVKNVLNALQQLAIAHRSYFSIPVIGIAGDRGKTIVKEWLYHLLKEHFSIVRSPKSYNSQIGVALSVLEITAEHNLAIFEAGISQPGEMKRLSEMIQPTLGAFTGVGTTHSPHFESLAQKKAEKWKLFEGCEQVAEPNALAVSDVSFPFRDKASVSNGTVVAQTARYLGVSATDIQRGLRTLPPVATRLEQLEGIHGCLLVNDTYTLDPATLDSALKYVNHLAGKRKKVLLLGWPDRPSEAVTKALTERIHATSAHEVVVIGGDDRAALTIRNSRHFPDVAAYLNTPVVVEDAVVLIKGTPNHRLEKIVQHHAAKKHITQLRVDLSALRSNLNFFRTKVDASVQLLAMVKAQSYGSGLVEIARFLVEEGVHAFGVAYADEGVALRKAGIDRPILVMHAEESAFDDIVNYQLEPSIYSKELLDAFIRHLIGHQRLHFPIHLKFDTGMHRLGILPDDLPELTQLLNTQPEVYVKTVFSHLAAADDRGEAAFTRQQIALFQKMSRQLAHHLGYRFGRHLANSSAVLNYPETHFEMVRVGIGMYGLLRQHRHQLKQVLALHTLISQIKQLQAGDSVGYGRSFVARSAMTIGVLPVGYADGLKRGAGNGKWHVIVNGRRAPIVGNVCMDMCMVDISGNTAQVGDKAQVFGPGNDLFELADTLNTIPYEVMATSSNRIHKVYLDV